jgi:hypothetical protein
MPAGAAVFHKHETEKAAASELAAAFLMDARW